jgi:hypothetical protein
MQPGYTPVQQQHYQSLRRLQLWPVVLQQLVDHPQLCHRFQVHEQRASPDASPQPGELLQFEKPESTLQTGLQVAWCAAALTSR